MPLEFFQVDSFTNTPFKGNPAAICFLEEWLPEADMQAIAQEMNVSETSFIVPTANGFHIRWFTPTVEIKLCGHATLAAAHILFTRRTYEHDTVTFDSLSGPLIVKKCDNDLIEMDFPANKPKEIDLSPAFGEIIGGSPTKALATDDLLLVYENANEVKSLQPDFFRLEKLPYRGVIAAALSEDDDTDVVFRFFAPAVGINEDPVTGSAMTKLGPYFADVLNTSTLRVHQCSARGGHASLRLFEDRIAIRGSAITVLKGSILLPSESPALI